ncbi:hypothetical protein EMIT0P44_110102 [Pseudomonas sp. IT-P44]
MSFYVELLAKPHNPYALQAVHTAQFCPITPHARRHNWKQISPFGYTRPPQLGEPA